MKQASNKHTFAFYTAELSSSIKQPTFAKRISLTDATLVHRIMHVLRLEVGQQVILFDRHLQAIAQLETLHKNKALEALVIDSQPITYLQPSITVLLPLLKKESLETALYSLAEIGVNEIQLLITAKSQQRWAAHDMTRAHKIVIAAAEQSKNFALPVIKEPVHLEQWIASGTSYALFCDGQGEPIFNCLEQATAYQQESVVIALGPEGDMTGDEKRFLKEHNFIFCKLTPTILRACQAAGIAAGIIRSYYAA